MIQSAATSASNAEQQVQHPSLITPFLDNQVNYKNQYDPDSGTGHELQPRPKEELSQETVVKIVKDAFTSATERHIEVGDGLQMLIITKTALRRPSRRSREIRWLVGSRSS